MGEMLPASEKFESFAKSISNRIAVFLDSLDLSEAVRQEIIDSMENMSLEDLVFLSDELEAMYISKKTSDIDAGLESELEHLHKKLKKKNTAVDEETVRDLEALMDTLE